MPTRWPVGQLRVGQHRSEDIQHNRRDLLIFCLLLAAGLALRFWQVGGRPGWQSDEPVYTNIAGHILSGGLLQDHLQQAMPWQPFLFHPPFYFLLLAGWFKLVGVGIPQARELSVLASGVMFFLLFRMIKGSHGPGAALVAVGIVIFDGWLLFIERVSYIENTLLVLVVGGLLLYQHALRRRSATAFVLAGLVLGCAVIFKQTGTYVLPVVALNWLITRSDGRKHLLLFGAALSVVLAYFGAMIWLFDYGGHRWFLDETLVQIQRVVGLRQSRGTLNSPFAFLHLLGHQYAIFIPSLLVAVSAIILLARRCIQCARARTWEPVRSNSLLFSWSMAGIAVFGASHLHFPQYFALVLIPLYCYLWTELYKRVQAGTPRLTKVAAVLLAIVIAANLGTFYLRVLARNDNVLRQVQQYAFERIPRNDTVITEEEIADLIPQRWCSVARSGACKIAASYVITYTSFLQPVAPSGDANFRKIMRGASKAAVFRGFKETVTVWRLR